MPDGNLAFSLNDFVLANMISSTASPLPTFSGPHLADRRYYEDATADGIINDI